MTRKHLPGPIIYSGFFIFLFSSWLATPCATAQQGIVHTWKSTHPYIYFRSVVLLALKEFWCGIRRAATPRLQQLSSRKQVTEAEVWRGRGEERRASFNVITFNQPRKILQKTHVDTCVYAHSPKTAQNHWIKFHTHTFLTADTHTHLRFWCWGCGPAADSQPSGLCGRCCGSDRNGLLPQSVWTSSWRPSPPYGHEPPGGLHTYTKCTVMRWGGKTDLTT